MAKTSTGKTSPGKTVYMMFNCGKCRLCLAGGYVHGPKPTHFRTVGKNRQRHLYGAGSDGGGSSSGPGASSKGQPLPPPSVGDAEDIRRDEARGRAERHLENLTAEQRECINALVQAHGALRTLSRQRQRRIKTRSEELAHQYGQEPPGAIVDAIAEEERAHETDQSGPLKEWITIFKTRLRETLPEPEKKAGTHKDAMLFPIEVTPDPFANPFDEDWGKNEKPTEEEAQRARLEAKLVREAEKAERSRLYQVIMEQGGLKTRADLREEYAEVPNTYKRKDGLAGDELADYLKTYYAEFDIEDERDLLQRLAA